MADAGGRGHLLRERPEHGHARVTNVELFFDLVFVFAITQLSHYLLAELSLLGAVRTGLGFFVPGLGRSTTEDWDIEGAHLAERCSLFIIIALGESLLITGATVSGLTATPANVAAFTVAFVSSVALWWIYFDTGAERGSHRIASSDDPGRLGRLAYTYLHIPIVAGIIVSAVADELVLAHPTGHTQLKVAAAIIGGPLLFLLGNLLFKGTIAGRLPLSHLVGLAVLAVTAPAAAVLPPLALGAAATGVLVVVAAWETISLRSKGKKTAAV